MKNQNKIFVIVVTYKGRRWYDKCFGSLRESTIPIQTVVVDNTPGEDDLEYIKSHFPEVHIIKTNENLGFGRANNLGMRYAMDNGCDYVFLLNQDAWIESDAIEKLVNIYQKHLNYGIISPMHLSVDEKKLVMECFCRQSTNKPLIEDLYFNRLKDIYETEYIHAAAWLLSKKTLELVGGFDPIFFQYGEDDNYLNRVIYHRLKIGVCPAVRIVHDHHDSIMTKEQQNEHNKKILLVKWTNINEKFSVRKIVRYSLRKILVNILSGRFEDARRINAQLVYCIKMRKMIKKSREYSVLIQPSWL